MAPKAHQEAAKKKAAKQKKRLMILAVPLLAALVYAYMTLSSLGAAPAGATPPAATTPAGSTPTPTAPTASPVTPGIALPPAGTVYSFGTLGQKDPFYDDGPVAGGASTSASSGTSSSSGPNYTSSRTSNPPIADQSKSTPTSTAVSHDAGLNTAILKASQVGPGYQLKTGVASTRVQGTVTLDICGFGFKSEADRTARLQEAFVKPEVGLVLSNELVRYKSGGTTLAMHELAQAVATCPHHPVASPTGAMTWRIHKFAAPNLLPGAMALSIQVTATNSKGHEITVNGFGIYQTRGTILSGVYVLLPPGSNLTTAQAQAFAVHLAQTSASNMKKAH